MSNFVDVGLRDLVKRGDLPGPDVLATGYHVRPQPAAEAFLEAPELGDLMGGLTTTDALRRFVRFNLSRNVDWIKVLATERAGTPDTDPRKQVYTEAELTVIVAEAAARGVPVLAHAHGAEGALAAVKAGVRSIEHGTYLTDETLTLMAQRGVFFDPTADVVNDLAMPGGEYDHAGLAAPWPDDAAGAGGAAVGHDGERGAVEHADADRAGAAARLARSAAGHQQWAGGTRPVEFRQVVALRVDGRG